jgi:hypothetical protein
MPISTRVYNSRFSGGYGSTNDILKIVYGYLMACILENGGSVTFNRQTVSQLLAKNALVHVDEDSATHSIKLYLVGHEGVKAVEDSYERQLLNS